MAILGVLLAMINSFFISNQDLSRRQLAGADINLMLKQSMLRLNDVISQTSYIYPSGQTLTRSGETLTIGPSTLAVLIPEDTTYCKKDSDSSPEYCGYIFTVKNRANYVSVVGSSPGAADKVLVEYQTPPVITWNIGSIPTKNWTSFSYTEGVVIDSIDADVTNLGSAANMIVADKSKRSADDKSSPIFSYADVSVSPVQTGDASAANALIQSVSYTISIASTYKGSELQASRSNRTLAKVIPRAGLPIVQ